jgi:hypothetical protein
MAHRYYKTTQEFLAATFGEMIGYLHPDYIYYKTDWDMIRDTIAGERRIKEKGEFYLPRLDSDETDYEAYRMRAAYVNMVARTQSGLLGTVFRRPMKILGLTDQQLKSLESVTPKGLSLNMFAKRLASEIIAVGRVGVLVDVPKKGGKPYMTEYLAENILSWKSELIDDKEQLTYVLLREIVESTPQLKGAVTMYSNDSLKAQYRVLRLENGVYTQSVFDDSMKLLDTITPTKGGAKLNFIPFAFAGPHSPTPEIQKSPLYDIAGLNLKHYRTSAQLEHGRYYTALPVYYVNMQSGEESGDYYVGPNTVWEVGPESKPGILEYFGTGLASLERSLTEAEEHVAQLGGRIMGIRPTATAESDNIFKMKQANETSILLSVTESLSACITTVLRWWLDWQRIKSTEVVAKLNQDFKDMNIAARELRAVALLYQSGILPIQDVYRVLQASEFIAEDTTEEKFIAMLNDLSNFPNQPDVEAMHAGYPSMKDKMMEEQLEEQLEIQQGTQDTDVEMQNKELRLREFEVRERAKSDRIKAKQKPAAPAKKKTT